MAKLSIQVGSTSKTINVYIRSTITGEGLTGLVYNSAGLSAFYTLPLSAPVAITLATQTVTGAWSSGGFVEIDSVKSPGLYRLDLPNAALASGTFVDISLLGANNMINYIDEIELTGWNATTGAVSSVTGNVGGNVVGSVGSVTARVTANVDEIAGSTTAATNLSTSAQTMQSGAAVTGTLTSSVFTTNLASTVTGAYVGRFILFTSGALIQQAQTIAAYSNTGQITTIQPFTTAPSNTDTFVIV
jgi:hypothetical protein